MHYEEIVKWLRDYNIANYKIGSDLVVDVSGTVSLFHCRLTTLPFQFGKVTGYFDCSDNYLTSLVHCPKYVGKGFDCSSNHITSLAHCPKYVGRSFWCHDNPLTITEENEEIWLQAIATNSMVYIQIEKPTEKMTNLHKVLWEI